MLDQNQPISVEPAIRSISQATNVMDSLGPLKLLAGKWKNVNGLENQGWNSIALPFVSQPADTPPDDRLDYRLLLNRYNEELNFTLADENVANRGVFEAVNENNDQFVSALRYQQTITQVKAVDRPESGKAGNPGLPIHFEPGLWLYIKNNFEDNLNIARLSTIPHGNTVLALGRSQEIAGPAEVLPINGLPIGTDRSLERAYLAPYRHFERNPFEGVFNPVEPTQILRTINRKVNIKKTTVLRVDTNHQFCIPSGGILNIPFVTRQANSASMTSTFWIQEVEDKGQKKMRLQYAQVVMLKFFSRSDGLSGLLEWPHVSINTLEKVE